MKSNHCCESSGPALLLIAVIALRTFFDLRTQIEERGEMRAGNLNEAELSERNFLSAACSRLDPDQKPYWGGNIAAQQAYTC